MHTRSAILTLTSRQRAAAALATLLAGFTVSACSAFFVPDQKDDEVARCNTSEDCEPPDDNRHVAACVYGEGQPENSEKVCIAAFDEINCNPQAYGGDHPLVAIHEELVDNQTKAAYGACADANLGKRGCAPNAGACDSGLEVIDGICDDPDALLPAINPSQVGGVDIAGQDALDQFCRYYFCDESFVCDTSGSKWTCKSCENDEAFGAGGCGTLYIQGEPSPVYTHPNDSGGNCEGKIPTDEVEFGPPPEPLTP